MYGNIMDKINNYIMERNSRYIGKVEGEIMEYKGNILEVNW